eukprot:scaffold168563_cov28-Tisochrysis_lutea.AAC.1
MQRRDKRTRKWYQGGGAVASLISIVALRGVPPGSDSLSCRIGWYRAIALCKRRNSPARSFSTTCGRIRSSTNVERSASTSAKSSEARPSGFFFSYALYQHRRSTSAQDGALGIPTTRVLLNAYRMAVRAAVVKWPADSSADTSPLPGAPLPGAPFSRVKLSMALLAAAATMVVILRI